MRDNVTTFFVDAFFYCLLAGKSWWPNGFKAPRQVAHLILILCLRFASFYSVSNRVFASPFQLGNFSLAMPESS